MQKSKFIWGILVFGVFVLAACSKANAPTNSNFEAAIKKYMLKHQNLFTVYSGSFPRKVVLKDNSLLCEASGGFGDSGYSSCSSFSINEFRVIKSAGFYVQQGEVPLGSYVTEPNPDFPGKMAQYNKKMEEYKKAMIEFNQKMKVYNRKAAENEAIYTKQMRKYDSLVKRKAVWCRKELNYINPPPVPLSLPKANLCAALLNTGTVLPGLLSTPKPTLINSVMPDQPTRPSKPTDKFISVPKSYPAFVVSGGNTSCTSDTCRVPVGKLEFSKIISATQPATSLGGVIVSQVKFGTKPSLLQNANVLPKDPNETTERIFTISLVKQTQGWSGEGENGGIIHLQ